MHKAEICNGMLDILDAFDCLMKQVDESFDHLHELVVWANRTYDDLMLAVGLNGCIINVTSRADKKSLNKLLDVYFKAQDLRLKAETLAQSAVQDRDRGL